MRFPTGLGQYVPVVSPVHSLDAVAKIGLVGVLAVSIFLLDGFAGLTLVAVLVAATVRVSRVPARAALRGIVSLSLILSFTLLAHALDWNGTAQDAIVTLGRLQVTVSGLRTGLFFAFRIVILIVGTSLLTLTTSPVDLAGGLERLMRPFSKLGFPAHDVAMMLTIALRFIPTTAVEAERIVMAQSARGARFGEGGPVRRARAYAPVLIPLFVGLFQRADRLATAMEARCYRGGEGRTRMVESRMTGRDWTVLFVGAFVLVLSAVLL